MRRLGIFLFYDKQGLVSPHILRSLRAFKPFLDEILFVSNGYLDENSYDRISDLVTYKLVRENIGFDVWGYKEGLEYIGYDNLGNYDEIVFLNYTFFAPFNDIGIVFDTMLKKNIDFWGMTSYQDNVKDFLQSYFLVSCKSLHATEDFKHYWQEMPMIRSVNDSLEYHEFRFSSHFRRLGYRGSAFIENEPGWNGNTTLVDIKAQLDRGLPLIKYRAFNFESNILERRGGRRPIENFNLVAEHTDYPIGEIWDYIISQTSVDQLIINTELMTFTETAPVKRSKSSSIANAGLGAVLIAVLSDPYTVDSAFERMEIFSAEHVFVVTNNMMIADRARSLGHHVHMGKTLQSPLNIWFSEVAKIVQPATPVFVVSDFPQERSRYAFKDILFKEYWDPLIASDKTIEQITIWLKDNPHIGIGFAPTSSVDGRENRHKGVDLSAANWTFKEYPAYAKGAISQKYWPWMGICVLRGELFSRSRLKIRLEELASKSRVRDREPFADIEGILPELVRQERLAPALVVPMSSVPKLILRAHMLEEQRDATILQLVHKFRSEKKVDRKENGDAPSVVEDKPPLNIAKVSVPQADLTPPPRASQSITYNAKRNMLTLKMNGAERTVAITPFAEGHIDEVRIEAGRVYVRGWAFDGKASSNTLLIGVLHNDQLLGAFVPSTMKRDDVVRAYASQKIDPLCGFSTSATVPHIEELDLSNFSIVILEETKPSIWIAPLRKGSLKRKDKPSV